MFSFSTAHYNGSAKKSAGYHIFKNIHNFLNRNELNKKESLIVSNFPNYLVPFKYNAISIETFNNNLDNIILEYKNKKFWKEIIVIQIFNKNKLIPQSEIKNKNIHLKTTYEKNFDNDFYMRFSILDC